MTHHFFVQKKLEQVFISTAQAYVEQKIDEWTMGSTAFEFTTRCDDLSAMSKENLAEFMQAFFMGSKRRKVFISEIAKKMSISKLI